MENEVIENVIKESVEVIENVGESNNINKVKYAGIGAGVAIVGTVVYNRVIKPAYSRIKLKIASRKQQKMMNTLNETTLK